MLTIWFKEPEKWAIMTIKTRQHKVPTVPGALGESPEPKPRAMQWKGLAKCLQWGFSLIDLSWLCKFNLAVFLSELVKHSVHKFFAVGWAKCF